MRLHGLSTLLALCHAVGAVSTVAVTVGAAQVPDIPRFDIQSKQDLIVALGTTYDSDAAFPQAPMIAAEGRRVVPWLLEIAGDEREPLGRRLVALAALGYTRDPSAVPLLLRFAVEGTRALSLTAQTALIGYSLPEVCEFWASRLSVTYPGSERTAAANAAHGIGYCDPRYEPMVREIARASTDWLVQEPAERSLAQLALPESERLKGPLLRGGCRVFAGPPRPDGVYVPSDSMAARIRWFVCQPGCPDGLLPPDFNLRGRRR